MFPFRPKNYDKYIEDLAVVFKKDRSAFTTALFATPGWSISDENSRGSFRIPTENNGEPTDIYIAYTGKNTGAAFKLLAKNASRLFTKRQFGTIMLNSFTFSKMGEYVLGQSKNEVVRIWEYHKRILGQRIENLFLDYMITEYDVQCPNDNYVDYISLATRNGKSLDGISVYFKKNVSSIMAIEALKERFGKQCYHDSEIVIWSNGPFNIFYQYKNNYICTHDRRTT